MTMPSVNLTQLNAVSENWDDEAKTILNIVVKKNGQIRATKPKVDESKYVTGKAAYVWRMVAFLVSPNPVHQCMPMNADFDLPAYDKDGKWHYPIAHKMGEDLKYIEDAIVNAVPKDQWHSVHRWAKAFGKY